MFLMMEVVSGQSQSQMEGSLSLWEPEAPKSNIIVD